MQARCWVTPQGCASAKFRSDSLIKEVDTQKVLEGTIAINPSTRHQHTFSTSGAKPEDWYQIEISVDPEVFNKLQPVYHQTPFAKPDSKSTVVVQRRMGVSQKPKSLDDLALLARPDSYFTPDGTALTFYVESVVPADEQSILHSDKNADWGSWVKKIKDLPFTLDEH
ncbi:hypothetical protein F5051DRAFT_418833 [Lentinula edodes]|nr:hypothetical protein F5051DRAFT_418833 [Lentinula edodes]